MKLKVVLALADCIRRAKLSGRPFTAEHVMRIAGACQEHHHGFDVDRWHSYVETGRYEPLTRQPHNEVNA